MTDTPKKYRFNVALTSEEQATIIIALIEQQVRMKELLDGAGAYLGVIAHTEGTIKKINAALEALEVAPELIE